MPMDLIRLMELSFLVSPGRSAAGAANVGVVGPTINDATTTVAVVSALVELARTGDADAFGQLYDHYHPSVYRFVYWRTRSTTLAEDLTRRLLTRDPLCDRVHHRKSEMPGLIFRSLGHFAAARLRPKTAA